jgi:hypothetical protein
MPTLHTNSACQPVFGSLVYTNGCATKHVKVEDFDANGESTPVKNSTPKDYLLCEVSGHSTNRFQPVVTVVGRTKDFAISGRIPKAHLATSVFTSGLIHDACNSLRTVWHQHSTPW